MTELLVDELANELRHYRHSQMASGALAEHILAIPRIREALDLKHNLETALEANGEFYVTKESVRGKGGVSAS